MSLPKVLVAAGVLFAIYLPVGFYLRSSYVAPSEITLPMSRPFVEVAPSKYRSLIDFDYPRWIVDTERIPITVFEGEKRVGTGKWILNVGIVFSRDDAADPNLGGIKYHVSMPKFVDPKYTR